MSVGRRLKPMHGLLSVDVTDVVESLHSSQPPGTLTAHVISATARAVAAHPEVHAYRDWLGRLVIHTSVDVATIVEVETPEGPFPLAHVVRNAAERTVPDVTGELATVKTDPRTSDTGLRLRRYATIGGRIPGVPRLFYTAMSRSPRMRIRTGTVVVSSVGMFAGGGGHGLGVMTIHGVSVLVGGRERRPVVMEDVVAIRDVLDVTVSIDHGVVDGGPATRFVRDLREMLSEVPELG